MGAKFRRHPGWMAQANGLLAFSQQSLEDVIDAQIARRAGQHLGAAADGLANQLHDRRGFARAGRAMNDRHVVGLQGEPHGLALRLVQQTVERLKRLFGAKFRRPFLKQRAAQRRQAVACRQPRPFQRRALSAAGRIVAAQIEPQGGVLFSRLRRFR